MPDWITHFMVGDVILRRFPHLDRRGFCMSSIAPDWAAYTPSREVIHWMRRDLKIASDADAFYWEYIHNHTESDYFTGILPLREFPDY